VHRAEAKVLEESRGSDRYMKDAAGPSHDVDFLLTLREKNVNHSSQNIIKI